MRIRFPANERTPLHSRDSSSASLAPNTLPNERANPLARGAVGSHKVMLMQVRAPPPSRNVEIDKDSKHGENREYDGERAEFGVATIALFLADFRVKKTRGRISFSEI